MPIFDYGRNIDDLCWLCGQNGRSLEVHPAKYPTVWWTQCHFCRWFPSIATRHQTTVVWTKESFRFFTAVQCCICFSIESMAKCPCQDDLFANHQTPKRPRIHWIVERDPSWQMLAILGSHSIVTTHGGGHRRRRGDSHWAHQVSVWFDIHTRLYTHRADVDKENQDRLKGLQGPAIVYKAQDTGSTQSKAWLDKNCIASSRLELKLGAQVMLLKNMVLVWVFYVFVRNLLLGWWMDPVVWLLISWNKSVSV